MKILVTGATGFLGSHLCKRLKEKNHDVFEINSKTNDLTLDGSLDELKKYKFDRIYHLAAWTQAGDFCLYHPAEQWVVNQKINTNILSFWMEHQPQAKMIAMGTSCSYDPEMPHIEDNYLKGLPTDSLFTYAMTKRMLFAGLLAANKQYGLNYLYFIPSTLYGPGYHTDKKQLHFIFDLMKKIVNAKNTEDPVVLWGDGYQIRELIHVNDFINIMFLLDSHNNEIINIGSGNGQTIRDFADKICKIVDYDPSKIQYDTSKYVGAKSKVLNINKLKNILPEYQLITLEEGFQEILKTTITV